MMKQNNESKGICHPAKSNSDKSAIISQYDELLSALQMNSKQQR
jgi:hypothetical protein